MIKISFLILLLFFLTSCDQSDPDSQVMPVYNLAYQENYAMDKVSDVLGEAKKAYVIIDPFDDDKAASVSAIKDKDNEVSAYISIGTGESYRADFSAMQPFLVTEAWESWSDEYFVDKITSDLLDIMKARIDKIAGWGFDWVEFDNMDWFYDDYQRSIHDFQVTIDEGTDYYRELCDYVHSKSMKCMAKNTVENASDFDGVIYESSHDEKNWWDQSGAQSFLDAGKPVIINHYNEKNCTQAYQQYKNIYNDNLSFICEDTKAKKYVHFNQ